MDAETERRMNEMCNLSEVILEQGLKQGIEIFVIDSCLQSLKSEYDGYHFHQSGEGIYNPYSLLNAFTDPVPLLYQTGYLTIKGYDSSSRTYTVGFPNNEVKYGFLNSFLPQYTPDSFSGSGRC